MISLEMVTTITSIVLLIIYCVLLIISMYQDTKRSLKILKVVAEQNALVIEQNNMLKDMMNISNKQDEDKK